MCGICGIFGLSDPPDIGPMLKAMRHRGPDDSGQTSGRGYRLGMTRLAILDLSPLGHQPMSGQDGGIWIVYNGETYNFHELRGRLEGEGHRFATGTDTEVVLALYQKHGDAFLPMLRGMFALAILDARQGPGRERLLLARDPLGVKPLLWAQTGDGLVFASEMKAMLASGLIRPEMDPEALRCLLCLGSIPQPRTAVRGVNMLLPGRALVIQNRRMEIRQWWDIRRDEVPGLRQAGYPEQVRAVRQTLEKTVDLHMLSDVPVGAFLSGGVDSAALTALMGRAAGRRIKTFSVGFEEEGAHIDESVDALAMARHLGTDHHQILVRGPQVRDGILDVVSALDQPCVDGVNSYFVSQAARREVTVALSGTGGDELFGGYPWFADMAVWSADRQAAGGFHPFRRAALWDGFNFLALGRRAQALERHRREAGFAARFAREYFIFPADQAARLLSPRMRRLCRAGREPSLDGPAAQGLPAWSPVERVSWLCLRGYAANQLLRDIDCMSMAHSLEVRVPFLDRIMCDLAFSLPDQTKLAQVAMLRDPAALTYRQRGIKRILLDACRDLLPPDIDLQPKRGFAMPFEAWLRGPLREVLLEALSPQAVRERGLFDAEATGRLLDRFLHHGDSWVYVWLLMTVELWCRLVLDRAGGGS